jgi:hypothetical protein
MEPSTNTVSPNQLLLTGNPYPSALDAIASLTIIQTQSMGPCTWEHYTTNNTHVLRDYQGYGERNLTEV